MDSSPNDIIKFYSNRGKMENFIKEAKFDFGMGTLSHTSYITKANKAYKVFTVKNEKSNTIGESL